jgi:drug/metabolite transporter (DMT)-like permease
MIAMDATKGRSHARALPAGPAIWCLASAALFGAAAPFTKPIVASVDPFALAGLLYLGAALGVLPFAARSLRLRNLTTRRNVLLVLGATLSGGVVGPVLLLLALNAASATSLSLWLTFEPVATALIAWLLFREVLQARIWTAVALVVAASALLTDLKPAGLLAAALAASACACWGLDNNLVARIDDISPAAITLAKGLVAGATNLAIGVLIKGATLSGGTGGRALIIGGVCYGLSIALFVAGAQQLGAVRAQLLFALAPFMGAALSWALLGEVPTGATGVAVVLMIAAAFLAATARHEHEHEHEPIVHSHLHRHDDGHHDHDHEAGDAPARPGSWHLHEHAHSRLRHAHPHVSDVHHAHPHRPS